MNKISIIAFAAAAMLGLSACDEYTLPNPPAQSNPAEPVFKAEGLTVTNMATSAVNLADLLAASEQPVLATAETVDFPSNSTLKLVLEISADETFEKLATVNTNIDTDGIVRASVYDFQAAINTAITRNLEPITIHTRYAAYAVNEQENVRIGGPDVYYAPGTMDVVPVLIGHEIAESYILVGNFCDWDPTKGITFTKVKEGNQYDEPEFMVKVEVSAEQAADGFLWKIVPATAATTGSWEGAYGATPATDGATNGTLTATAEGADGAGAINAPGSYLINVNMYALTYTTGYAYDQLYINATGWYTDAARMLLLTTKDYINYSGVARVNHSFAIFCQPSISKGLGYGLAEGTTVEVGPEGNASGQMQLFTDLTKVARFDIGGNGLYWMKANIVDLTWSAAPINVISIVGAFNEWNVEDANAAMTPDARMRNTIWTISNVEMPAGEFKFCVNHAWDISFGGAMDNIVENGGNLNLAEAGTYDITLDFTTRPYTAKAVKH